MFFSQNIICTIGVNDGLRWQLHSFASAESVKTSQLLQVCVELGGFHRTSVSVISRLELQQFGGRQRLTSSAETQWKWSRDYSSQHALGLSAWLGGSEPLGQKVQDILQCFKPAVGKYNKTSRKWIIIFFVSNLTVLRLILNFTLILQTFRKDDKSYEKCKSTLKLINIMWKKMKSTGWLWCSVTFLWPQYL